MHQGWKKTEEFKEALKMGNIEQTQRLPFREAGEKALVFLKEQIKGTPFGANYGNMDISYAQLDLGEKNKKAIKEKNVSLSRNIFFRREKKFFEYIVYQLVKGEVPHRNEMINLGMILRLNYEQMNDLLSLCGENTLYARNIYEGALLTVWKFLSEMRPEWFEEKESDLYDDDLENLEQKEKIFNRDYKVEVKLGGPIDFCVLASQQVERALTGLSEKEFKKILKEKQLWKQIVI